MTSPELNSYAARDRSEPETRAALARFAELAQAAKGAHRAYNSLTAVGQLTDEERVLFDLERDRLYAAMRDAERAYAGARAEYTREGRVST